MRIAFLIVLCVALLVSVATCSRRPSEELAIGVAAPAFKLPDLRGNQVSLGQYRGKIVLLDFWATWCGPCRMTMPVLERIQSQYSQDLVLLAINLQEPREVVQDYVRQQNLHSTVLLDEQGDVGRIYQSESIPMQVLIDPEGIVRHIQVGFSPRMGDQLRQMIERFRAQ